MAAAGETYASLLAEFAIPHRAKYAHRALLKAGLDALPTIRRGLRHENADSLSRKHFLIKWRLHGVAGSKQSQPF